MQNYYGPAALYIQTGRGLVKMVLSPNYSEPDDLGVRGVDSMTVVIEGNEAALQQVVQDKAISGSTPNTEVDMPNLRITQITAEATNGPAGYIYQLLRRETS